MLPTTNSVLLESLLREDRDDSGGHWREFDSRYRPVLVGFARRLSLSEEDARELAQDVLVTFVEEYRGGRYDPGRGRLRAWLFAIARARVARLRRERARDAGRRGESALADLPDDGELTGLWEAEWRRAILRAGMEELRARSRVDGRSLAAFEAVTLGGRSTEEAAAELGMTANAVYIAKFRTLERLRAILARLEQEF